MNESAVSKVFGIKPPVRLSLQKLKNLHHDVVKAASAVRLVYVADSEPGIQRVKKGKSFNYIANRKKITDASTIFRIKSLVIPPAWRNVWICAKEEGHLQATGYDTRGRKQYRYHPAWNALRNQTKFYHLLDFGKALPAIRRQLEKDLAKAGLPVEKVLAAVVMLMLHTSIRIGNSMYEKLYGSFGLTTLKDQHVRINGSKMIFRFRGKKGVEQNLSLKNKKLATIVKQCRDIPGKELFQYYDEAHQRHTIDSGMVNDYIRQISGEDFSAKDFRTWTGTLHALHAFKQVGCCETLMETKKQIAAVLDSVAQQLGNTRTVCKKYYVHPLLIDSYTNKKLAKYFDTASVPKIEGLKPDEELLLHILSKERSPIAI